MVKIPIQGVERYYDGYMKENLEIIRQFAEKKWDGILYVGGYEGDGKSWLAAQVAVFLDPSYCLERCVFTPEQFLKAVDEAKPGEAIVYDEAQDVFEAQNRDKMAKIVKSKLTRIRRKRLYIVIVAPDFWRINKYLFIHRSRAFIRVYADGLERGYFAFYNRERKHNLYIKGKRTEELVVPPNFVGRFTAWFPLDHEAYEDKKEAATRQLGKEERPAMTKEMARQLERAAYHRLWNHLRLNQWLRSGFTVEKLASFAGCTKKTLYNNNYTEIMNAIEGGAPGFGGSAGGEHGSVVLPHSRQVEKEVDSIK